MAVTRDKLYEECWAEPMTQVAARYQVSSSFLARVCDRMNVPRPPRGYWAQLAVGKAATRPALPEPGPSDEIEWLREGEFGSRRWVLPNPPKVLSSTNPPRSKPSNRTLHHLIAGARGHFEKVRNSDNGYLRPFKKLLVDLYVSKDVLERALKLAEHTFMAFEERGYAAALAPNDAHYRRTDLDERAEPGGNRYQSNGWSPDRPTIVLVGTVAIALTFYELSESVEARYADGVYVRVAPNSRTSLRSSDATHSWVNKHDMPSGLLCLRASSPYHVASWQKSWRESKPGDLLSKAAEIIRELETDAAIIAELVREGTRKAKIEQAQLEEQWQRWEREAADKRRVESVKASRGQLLALVEAWESAQRVERFFEEVSRQASHLSEEERRALTDRARRARELFGGIDVLESLRAWQPPETT